MTRFETIVLHLLCKILTRMLQAPGARGTLPDALYIKDIEILLEVSKHD